MDSKVASPQVMSMTEVTNRTAHKDNPALHVVVLLNGNQGAGASHQIVMQNEIRDKEGKMIKTKVETCCTEANLLEEKYHNQNRRQSSKQQPAAASSNLNQASDDRQRQDRSSPPRQ